MNEKEMVSKLQVLSVQNIICNFQNFKTIFWFFKFKQNLNIDKSIQPKNVPRDRSKATRDEIRYFPSQEFKQKEQGTLLAASASEKS